MPMMVIDDKSFNDEISKFSNKNSNSSNREIVTEKVSIVETNSTEAIDGTEFKTEPGGKVVDILRGRSVGRLEIPNSVRMLVADEVINGAKAKDVSKAFGISESSISAYKHDATSTSSYDNPNKELAESNQKTRDSISDMARSKLLSALAHVTDDKLAEAKLRDVASVAASMSGIIKNLEPSNNFISQQNTQVIVYKPRQHEESDYEIITVNE